MLPNRIALTGFGRAGKDECAKPLYAIGYERRCFGDIIKSDLDDICRLHVGFSAFTENDGQKAQIRQLLEHYGEAAYTSIFNRYFADLPSRCVNTRLVRVREAEEWRRQGGVIYEVVKPHVSAETQWAHDRLAEVRRSGLINATIVNNGTIEQLHAKILAMSV